MKEHQSQALVFIPEQELIDRLRAVIRTELMSLLPNTTVEYSVPGLTQKPVYKATEVCAMLQISRQTLNEWKKSGLLPAYKIRSRLFFKWEDIEALLQSPPK